MIPFSLDCNSVTALRDVQSQLDLPGSLAVLSQTPSHTPSPVSLHDSPAGSPLAESAHFCSVSLHTQWTPFSASMGR